MNEDDFDNLSMACLRLNKDGQLEKLSEKMSEESKPEMMKVAESIMTVAKAAEKKDFWTQVKEALKEARRGK